MSQPKWSFARQFCADFGSTASELASRIDALDDVADVTADLARLTKSLGDATGSLPSYDQKQCELRLKALEKRIEERRTASTGVPKFSFKRKPAKPKPSTDHTPAVEPSPTRLLIEPARTLAGFSHRYLTVFDVRSLGASAEVSISDLDDCIVNLLPAEQDETTITALIILADLSECVVVVGCHQFRMHSSTSIDVYLESGSDPVIEHCSAIRFTAYPTSLVRGNPLQDSKHSSVKDFSHILPTPSPNWNPLPEEKWEKAWPVSILQDQALRRELQRMLPSLQT